MRHIENPYQLNTVSYDDIRPVLRTGDLFFCCGKGFLSSTIKRITKSPFSHVGVIAVVGGRVLTIEAIKYGTAIRRFSRVLAGYKGDVVIARSSATPEQLKTFWHEAVNFEGVKYGYWTAIRIWACVRFGIAMPKQGKAMICSDLVARCFREVGIAINANQKHFTSPEDVWTSRAVSHCFGRVEL